MKNPPTSVTPEYTTGRSQLESDDEVRQRCRNSRCRSKLPASVSNPREAFCTRGCHNSFYRHRCLICERPIEQPKRGKRLIGYKHSGAPVVDLAPSKPATSEASQTPVLCGWRAGRPA